MSYCVNPNCSHPNNPPQESNCLTCGSNLKLRGRYRATRSLGRGGFGATFLAADEGLPGHPSCVIKQLRPTTKSASVLKMARELFEREAFTLGKIGSHPQIPRLLDYFEEDENFYLVQEYVEGETLKQEYSRRGVFNEIEIRKILTEILPALGFIHENGVIHRDIKPANIMRRKQDGQLVLIDFGAVSTQESRAVMHGSGPNIPDRGEAPHDEQLTNFAIGTPGFAPPEQMAMRPVFSSDLYAIAMSCLYLLTGRSPKDFGHDPHTGEINWRSQVNLSEHLTSIFDRMLKPSIAQRFRSAEEVIQAMEARPSPSPVAPAPEPDPDPVVQPVPTNPMRPPISNSRIQGARSWNDMQTIGQTTRVQANAGKDLKGGRKVLFEYGQGRRNFASLDLTKAALGSATLVGVVMNRSKLIEADFCHADLTGASFESALMTQAKLSGTKLIQAKMSKAILTKADLGGACLRQADLREANLYSAYLSKADLSGANLAGANLKGAYLSQANLRGANLCGADLKGAKVTDEQLATAKTNWGTIRPDGGKRLF